jgi:hypothetical protein
MKIIFLDHDGVICLSNNWGNRTKKRQKYLKKNPSSDIEQVPVDVRFDDFDKKAIKLLNEIISETDAEIVITSDWRYHATLEELREYYTNQGIIKKPIATTEMFKDIFPKEWSSLRFRAELEFERAKEISHWLSEHKSVTNWVAIDDLNMSEEFFNKRGFESFGLNNFVHTIKENEGIKQLGIKEKIISFLT